MNATRWTLCTLAAAVLAVTAHAHDGNVHADADAGVGEVRLLPGLGNSRYAVASAEPQARALFEQGLRLLWAFNHHEALRAFRAAGRLDPGCALCAWGEAFALGPNINAPMDDAAGDPAVAAVRRASRLATDADPRVRGLVNALAERYTDDPTVERATLDRRYAEAMSALHRRYPDDDEIAMLAVDALMNLSPWDYWDADGTTPKGRIGEALDITERVLARSPDHAGAIHLFIHLTEASADPHRAVPYAERLADIAPNAGHLVHMGSHSLFRVGRYAESAALNKRAAAVDEIYLSQHSGSLAYASGYYPHNLHFVVASAQMVDDHASALDYADRLAGKVAPEVAGSVGWTQPIIAARYFAYADYAAPAEVLAIAGPEQDLPYVRAAWHYARGVAAVRSGELELARREAAHIARIETEADFGMLLAGGVPGPDVLRIARHVLGARVAEAAGEPERAIEAYTLAAEIQESLPYMEPPFWYFPLRRALGEALMAAGRPGEAERAFIDSLVAFPGDPAAESGLAQARAERAQATADAGAP